MERGFAGQSRINLRGTMVGGYVRKGERSTAIVYAGDFNDRMRCCRCR
ncbi:hypothetical protein [Bradyrhizobium sp. DASA03120]